LRSDARRWLSPPTPTQSSANQEANERENACERSGSSADSRVKGQGPVPYQPGATPQLLDYLAEHPSAGRLALTINADGKEQRVAYTPRGEQRAAWGESAQPLLYEFNDYGEMVAMRTFQTLPDGNPSDQKDLGARTAWHYHEPTGALLRKEYADGHGPEYAYTEAGQLKERTWARDTTEENTTEENTSEASAPAQRLSTKYAYDPTTLQLTHSTATDGAEVRYEYDLEGRLAKVTDATGTREFAYDLRGQVVKESVLLQPESAGGSYSVALGLAI